MPADCFAIFYNPHQECCAKSKYKPTQAPKTHYITECLFCLALMIQKNRTKTEQQNNRTKTAQQCTVNKKQNTNKTTIEQK